MKLNIRIERPLNRFYALTAGLFFLLMSGIVNAQSVSRVSDLNFGVVVSFGNGGTISVLPDFTYSTTGDIILTGIPSPAGFDLTVDPGKTVQMFYDKYVTLVGEHGGKMTLVLNDSSPTGDASIVTGVSPTRVTLGGTLTMGPSSTIGVGAYSGIIQVKFIVIY